MGTCRKGRSFHRPVGLRRRPSSLGRKCRCSRSPGRRCHTRRDSRRLALLVGPALTSRTKREYRGDRNGRSIVYDQISIVLVNKHSELLIFRYEPLSGKQRFTDYQCVAGHAMISCLKNSNLFLPKGPPTLERRRVAMVSILLIHRSWRPTASLGIPLVPP
jgi:hypothetical protein